MKQTKRTMSGSLVVVSGAVRPTQERPIDIRADLLAPHAASGKALDRRAVLWRHTPTQEPLLDVLVAGQPERLSSLDGATKEGDRMGDSFSTGHDGQKRKLEKLASQGILALTSPGHVPNLRAMETIHQRIRRLREARGLTQDELAALMGLTRQAVQKWESEREDRTSPTRKREQALADALGVTVAELIHGHRARDEVHSIVANDSAQSAYLNGNVIAGPDMARKVFPLISWVQAGMWTDICDNFEPGDADAWLPCHKDLGAHGFVLRVQGESMTTTSGAYSFPDGMLLYVHPELEALPGRFVIVRRNGNEATFKRLTSIDGELYLEALNPAWPNRYTKITPDDHICGVVVHAGFELP